MIIITISTWSSIFNPFFRGCFIFELHSNATHISRPKVQSMQDGEQEKTNHSTPACITYNCEVQKKPSTSSPSFGPGCFHNVQCFIEQIRQRKAYPPTSPLMNLLQTQTDQTFFSFILRVVQYDSTLLVHRRNFCNPVCSFLPSYI